jgi:membrane protein YqaA with SNARE-associated domain
MLMLVFNKLSGMVALICRGGLGLFMLGMLDGSVVPTFGAQDELAAVLAAREQHLWFYYAAISAVGTTIGALSTYRLGQKLGSGALLGKFGARRLLRVRRLVQRWGFTAVFVSALAPPPFPTSAIFLAAGSLNYGITNYISALVIGKAIRYGVITYIFSHYRSYGSWFSLHPGKIGTAPLVLISIIIAIAELLVLLLSKHNSTRTMIEPLPPLTRVVRVHKNVEATELQVPGCSGCDLEIEQCLSSVGSAEPIQERVLA